MNALSIAVYVFLGYVLFISHFLLGFGLAGGSWEAVIRPDSPTMWPTPEEREQAAHIAKTFDGLAPPLGSGIGGVLTVWPALLAFHITQRPGGRSW